MTVRHEPFCVRCDDERAVMWSGAFATEPDEPWIGWCSRACQSAWLAGDKTATTERTHANEEGER